jgi:prepilin-type N-terminal cleavage/methylation domain-containing protein
MKKRTERGYNLVELLVAIAVLGVVLMSVLSLFLWGRKNVYSGKQMTTAIAIGTRVMEDLAPLTKEDIYKGLFAITDTAVGSDFKFGNPQKDYADAAIRSTSATVTVTPAQADLNKESALAGAPKFLTDGWKKQLEDDKGKPRLDDGSITVIMMPRSDTVDPPRFGNSAVMQVRVVVSWLENRRRREVILDSVKAQ